MPAGRISHTAIPTTVPASATLFACQLALSPRSPRTPERMLLSPTATSASAKMLTLGDNPVSVVAPACPQGNQIPTRVAAPAASINPAEPHRRIPEPVVEACSVAVRPSATLIGNSPGTKSSTRTRNGLSPPSCPSKSHPGDKAVRCSASSKRFRWRHWRMLAWAPLV
jgi:hypothetical protein